ncbi:hypothetical protein KXR53_12520 [Inquilinus limosus]|uniref:hypothetical protein n=1 Tax=Inquilinus limosus TaxID=171674 RepID=UPI003F182063
MATSFLAACQTAGPSTPATQPEGQIHSEPLQVEGAYTHRYSSLQFPPAIADFTRTEMRKYDAGATNVSATYRRSGPAGAALGTIYIYPAPWVLASGQYPDLTDRQLGGLCRNELEAAKAAVVALHPDAKIVKEGGDVLKNPNGGRVGLGRVVYKMTDTFDGRVQPLQSQLYVMCFGWSQWILKFRLTAPEGVDLDAVYGSLGRGTLSRDAAALQRS